MVPATQKVNLGCKVLLRRIPSRFTVQRSVPVRHQSRIADRDLRLANLCFLDERA